MTGRATGRIAPLRSAWWAGVLAVAALGAACVGDLEQVAKGRTTQAIGEGTPTTGTEDHGVVWLVNESESVGFINLCTGTLITKRVVMTAAHCIAIASSLKSRVYFGAEPDRRNGEYHKVIHVERHPGFSGADASILANDVALLLLEKDAPAEAIPTSVIPSNLAPQLAGGPGRLAGYGIYNANDDIGKKHTGPVTISTVGDRTVRITPNPTFYCSGDSGGPLFATAGGTEYVVGIVSTSSAGCSADGDFTLTRADFFSTDFIEPFFNRIATGSRTLGDRCYFDGNCGQGSCTQSEARENVKYCSKTCASDSDCTGGMLCRGAAGQKMCHYPRVHPEVLTGLCIENIGCQTDRCSRFVSGGVRTCTIDCTPAEQNACPTGFACLPDITNGGSACLKSSTPPPGGGGGGCSSTGGASGAGLALLLGLFSLLALTRRSETHRGSRSP